MTWATIEQVEAITGVTVTGGTLAVASAMIDTFTGADEDLPEDSISAIDRKRLRKATAWQAAWIPGKPGLLTERELVTSVSSDGQSIQRESQLDAMCAPMAKREIANLSWVGTSTVSIPRLSELRESRNFLNERSDPPWLGSGT